MDYKQEQFMRMQQYQYAPKMPFYMSYPMQNIYMTEMDYDRDMERMKELYPEEAKRIQKLVEDECDQMEYEGSMMFDEYPDRLMLKVICERIYQNAMQPQMSEQEMHLGYGHASGQKMTSGQELPSGQEMAPEQETAFEQGAPLDQEVPFEQRASFEQGAPLDQEVPFEQGASFEQGAPLEQGASFEQELPPEQEMTAEQGLTAEQELTAEQSLTAEQVKEQNFRPGPGRPPGPPPPPPGWRPGPPPPPPGWRPGPPPPPPGWRPGPPPPPGRPPQNPGLGNLIEVLLYNEMYNRRCRHNRCRRWW